MLEISYDNVMNGFNKGIHMRLLCPSRLVAEDLFRRAKDLWHIESWSQSSNADLMIKYGPDGFPKIILQMRNFHSLNSGSSWRGFNGVHLFHPDLIKHDENHILSAPQHERLHEMHAYNERYLEQWRS